MECADAMNLDALCWAKRWALALPLIQRILERAEGLTQANLRLVPHPRYFPESTEELKVYE